MAHVIIDRSIFSHEWFRPVRGELLKNRNVRIIYSKAYEAFDSIRNYRDLFEYFKAAHKLNKREDVDYEQCAIQIDFLRQHQAWLSNSTCCDDPHIFSLVYLKSCRFVFSMDHRLAACRDAINPYIKSEYCRFIIISSPDTYTKHRQSIIS